MPYWSFKLLYQTFFRTIKNIHTHTSLVLDLMTIKHVSNRNVSLEMLAYKLHVETKKN